MELVYTDLINVGKFLTDIDGVTFPLLRADKVRSLGGGPRRPKPRRATYDQSGEVVTTRTWPKFPDYVDPEAIECPIADVWDHSLVRVAVDALGLRDMDTEVFRAVTDLPGYDSRASVLDTYFYCSRDEALRHEITERATAWVSENRADVVCCIGVAAYLRRPVHPSAKRWVGMYVAGLGYGGVCPIYGLTGRPDPLYLSAFGPPHSSRIVWTGDRPELGERINRALDEMDESLR